MLRFGTVGAAGALVNLVALWALVDVAGLHYVAAAAGAIELSIVSNFLLNRAWTWKDRNTSWWTLVTYHWVTALGTAIQFATLVACVEFLGLHYLVASLAGVAAGAGANFLGNDRLTFRPRTAAGAQQAVRIAMYGAALAVMVGGAYVFYQPWDTYVMSETVDDWVNEGRTPYQTAEEMPDHAYHGWNPPTTAQWFAYPPMALLALMLTAAPFVAADAPVWAVRIAVKAPAILGVLACAYLARRIAEPYNPARAVWVERLMLFNPVSLIVACIWGQFEPMLMAFALGSFLAIRARRWGLAGALLALAILTKPFAVFLLPIWTLLALHHGGKAAVRRSWITAGGLGIGMSLPFLLSSPHGFWYQIVGMHLERAPAKFSLINALEPVMSWILAMLGTGPEPGRQVLGVASLVATIGILWITARAAKQHLDDEGAVLRLAAYAMAGALVVGKVLNEQYFFLPVALLAAAVALPQPDHRPRHLLTAAIAGVSIAALADYMAAIKFIAPDVWSLVFAKTTAHGIAAIATALHTTVSALSYWGHLLAIAALVPAGILLMLALKPLVPRFKRPRGPKSHAHVAMATIAMLVIPMPLVGAPAAAIEPLAERDVDLIAYVRTDWTNPTNDPDVRAGNWLEVTDTPPGGFYTVNWARAVQDVQTLDAAGVDGVVLYADPTFEKNLKSWMMALNEVGISFHVVWAPGTPSFQAEDPTLSLWHRTLHPRVEARWAEDMGLDAWSRMVRVGAYPMGAQHLLEFMETVPGASPVLVPWNDYGGEGAAEGEPASDVPELGVTAPEEAQMPDDPNATAGEPTPVVSVST